ncbi:DUF2243 domain-containing protein [Deinococcus pimensis]|uniref:DUF2243 domain-containing protein n=1 Tax=Deinococcus pimensis TaxID=309888 RepID=UPI0005EB346D|nr:DUF2243 domain-containing protein [Deinococcus pimensis]
MTNAGVRDAAGTRRQLWGGTLLGVGFGGFFDGIVIHQLLQWHHFTSHREPPVTLAALKDNTFTDGLFHSAMYVVALGGLALLWSGARRSRRLIPPGALVGLLLLGWGVFNTYDSFVNHWALELHHVREVENPLPYDLGFLLMGFVLLALGVVLTRRAMAARF